ncbi:MAG: DUF423 domain-containing protein [Ferruginibacter sp.]|jgi:uncharacterized membrane protein YgdD (TMEM256/DUF423 family)
MMHKGFIRLAALLGALTVALGAFAAHRLRQSFSAEEMMIFETGVKYQFYHVLALFLSGILYREFSSSLILWAGRLFITGMMLFSGSLYLLAWLKSAGMESLLWVGAITPLGGTAFIAGWICLFIAAGKKS